LVGSLVLTVCGAALATTRPDQAGTTRTGGEISESSGSSAAEQRATTYQR
jgi:hypothetical protein